MAVSADQAPDPAPARARLRPWSRADPVAVLSAARHIADELADGLTGSGVRAAARGVRRLLEADRVGLADLSGRPVWAPSPPADEHAANELVEEVLHTETKGGRPPLLALPLHVHHELAGVLVVAGAVRRSAVREAAALDRRGARAGPAGGVGRAGRAGRAAGAARGDLAALRLQRADRDRGAGQLGAGPVARADDRLRRLHPVQPGPARRVHDGRRRVPRDRDLPGAAAGGARGAAAGAGAGRAGGARRGAAVPGAAAAGGERDPARHRAARGHRARAGARRGRGQRLRDQRRGRRAGHGPGAGRGRSWPAGAARTASVWPMWTDGCATSTARGTAWWWRPRRARAPAWSCGSRGSSRG